MEFFQKLHDLNLTGDLKLVVTRTGPEALVVSLLLNNEKCGDDARRAIPPLLLRGTPAEMDREFFDRIGQPLQATSGLIVDMEAYLRQVEAARKQSAMGKVNAAPATPAIDPKTVAYTNVMKQVQALVNAKKYKEAIGQLPDAKDYPAKKTVIEERKKWLVGMAMDGGGMFPQPYPVDADEVKPNASLEAEPVETPPPSPGAEAQANDEADQTGELEVEQEENAIDNND